MKRSSGALAFLLLWPITALADWPQWRGPNRDGLTAGPAWPANLQKLEQVWRVELGPGYSGPVVVGNRVFTTETVDRKNEVVRAFDRQTGKELWRTEWPGAMTVPFFARANGDWIRATPACDGERLYVAGMRDLLVCLDVANGKVIWQLDLMKEYQTPLPAFGFVCSPLIDGAAVYVQAGASLVRVDKLTGKVRWRVLQDQGGMYGSAFSSPVIATLAGQRQLVVQTRKSLAGIDPDTGQTLWSRDIPATQGMNILTPVIQGDRLFTSTYGGGSFGFSVTASEGRFAITPQWQDKTQGYMSTPVLVDEHLYIHLRNQRLACLRMVDGEVRWLSDQIFGKYMSLLARDRRILALDQRGTLYLLHANPEKLEIIDSKKVSEQETWAHLAIVGSQIFIRELNALSVFRWE